MDDFDPLADPEPFEPERDRYGRPLIIPATKAGKVMAGGKSKPYTRASTFAGYCSDKSGLTKWQVNHAVVGVAISPDLAKMIAALGPNPDDYEPTQKAELARIVETAHDRSGGNAKANWGTAVHTLTEPRNVGTISADMADDVTAYQQVMDAYGLEVVDTELFTVNDDGQTAGTYDHRVRTTRELTFTFNKAEVIIPAGTILMLDKKTGTVHFDEHAIQLAVYVHGQHYNLVTGERTRFDASPQWGLVAHIPKGQGKAVLYIVDLVEGWKGAKTAAAVRAYREKPSRLAAKLGEITVEHTPPAVEVAGSPAPVAQVVSRDTTETCSELTPTDIAEAFGIPPVGIYNDPIMQQIAEANDETSCRGLWRANHLAWTPAHTEAVAARLAELSAQVAA